MPNRFNVGDIEVTAVSDGEIWSSATAHYPGTTDEQWAHYSRWLAHDGKLRSPMGCFVVRSRGQTVLIATWVLLLGTLARLDWRAPGCRSVRAGGASCW